MNTQGNDQKTMKARDATKHPALFQNYWGSFTIKENDTITPEIIDNRNRFVEEFGVIRAVRRQTFRPFYSTHLCDHPESYIAASGTMIMICSNYDGEPPERFGMKPYLPLYSTATITYIRVFANAALMRSVMKCTEKKEG